jgi:hypothetical protein
MRQAGGRAKPGVVQERLRAHLDASASPAPGAFDQSPPEP